MSDSKKLIPIYLTSKGELTIDAPVPVVWRHAIDYRAWQNYSLVQHVSGTPGEEGELVILKKEEVSNVTPYFARTIKLEPGRRIVWKTYREGNPDFGIVEFVVEEVGLRARFIYSMLYERNLSNQSGEEAQSFRKRSQESSDAYLAGTLRKLKALCEGKTA